MNRRENILRRIKIRQQFYGKMVKFLSCYKAHILGLQMLF